MKNLGTALNETRTIREKTNGVALAGAFGIGWGLVDLPSHQLAAVLGMLLLLAAAAFDAAVLFSSLFMLGWWERRMAAQREREWIAASPQRVAEAIASYEAWRAQRRVN